MSEPLAFESVAGTYRGSFESVEPTGARLDGALEVVLSQVDESLTGSWEITGTTSRTGTSAIASGGGLSGTLPLGGNPSFELQMAYTFCPRDIMTFSASYDSATRTLALVGHLDMMTTRCRVLTTYPVSAVLGVPQ